MQQMAMGLIVDFVPSHTLELHNEGVSSWWKGMDSRNNDRNLFETFEFCFLDQKKREHIL